MIRSHFLNLYFNIDILLREKHIQCFYTKRKKVDVQHLMSLQECKSYSEFVRENISERSDSLSKLNFAIFLRESGDFVYGRQKSSLYRLPFSAFVKLVICK